MSFKKAIIILTLLVKGFDSGPIDIKEYVIKVRDSLYIPEILKLEPEIKFKKEIIPRLYVFSKDNGDGVTNDLTYLSGLKQRLKDKVEYIEEVKIYYKSIDNRESPEKQRRSYGEKAARHKRSAKELVLQPPYYGLGIPEAWGKGHTGKGVVIGLTDVGVVADIPDIRDNIDYELSKSFVSGDWNLEPTKYLSYPEVVRMDHGNNCAGLIVGSMNNHECTVGVAHEAKLAVLQIFLFKLGNILNKESQIALALVHELDKIPIYSNSWSSKIEYHFHRIPQFMKDALEHGAMKGRHGKGRINVFPPGGLAGGYANSPYTITVNAVGNGGRNMEFTAECACILTTAYGEGHTHSSTEFITTSLNPINCTDRFIGTSPATAVVSGIIALLLQHNDHLTWREVQYLIIQSSSIDGIQDTKDFVKNAAGRFYHSSYGYGLINAAKLVSKAEQLKDLPTLIVYNSQANNSIIKENTNIEAERTLHIPCPCNTTVKECMSTVEQVVVKTSFTTHLESETDLIVISPSQTKSYLMRSGHAYSKTMKRENAEFLSVHFWGEKAIGNWTLILRKTGNTSGTVSIESFSITLYGHMEKGTYKHNTLTPEVIVDKIYQQCQDMIAVNENGVPALSSHRSTSVNWIIVLFVVQCLICLQLGWYVHE